MIYLIDPAIREDMSSLKDFAKENVWSLDNLLLQKQGKKDPPGDDPNYVRTLWGSIRVVFTITEQPEFYTRHMSVSTRSDGDEIPHPVVLEEIMEMLGFFGKLESCMVFREPIPGGGTAINVVERIN